MSILILGNLYISNQHKRRLQDLVGIVTHITTNYIGISSIIPKYKYIFCCNFNLTPYIDYLHNCHLVVMAETGIVNIDVDKAKEKNINFCNLDTYSCDAVVQYVTYSILSKLRPWDNYFNTLNRSKILEDQSIGLETLAIGLIGYGKIGRKLAKILNAYGCKVVANTRKKFICPYAEYIDKEKLFEDVDIVIVCCELNESTKGLIDFHLLSKLKNNSILVSISQRDVFENNHLKEFLKHRDDITTYFDFDIDENDYDFIRLSNVNISPHLAFYTRQTIINRTESCIDRLKQHLKVQVEKQTV